MAIRICFGGREYQRLELRAVSPRIDWYVHSTHEGQHRRRAFTGQAGNYAAALEHAEAEAMAGPQGDIWLADDPAFTPLRYGIFEPNGVTAASSAALTPEGDSDDGAVAGDSLEAPAAGDAAAPDRLFDPHGSLGGLFDDDRSTTGLFNERESMTGLFDGAATTRAVAGRRDR